MKSIEKVKVNKVSTQRIFTVGDKWVYYKLYCGVKTADTILINIIKPLTIQWQTEGIIEKWFFIRYNDPDFHIRVRFLLTEIHFFQQIIEDIRDNIDAYISTNEVWDIQLATYKRELNRYGKNTIEIAESFFNYDTKAIISIISYAHDDQKRFINVLLWINHLLELFELDQQSTSTFLDTMQKQFKAEFKADRATTKSLNLKYKSLLKCLDEEESTIKFDNSNQLRIIVNTILNRNRNKTLEVELTHLIASFIHMSVNRAFRSKQRLYEMIIYDFLTKKYRTKLALYGKN